MTHAITSFIATVLLVGAATALAVILKHELPAIRRALRKER